MNESTWAETLLANVSGTQSGQIWTADLTETAMGGQEIIGERTLKVYATMTRGTKTYRTQAVPPIVIVFPSECRGKVFTEDSYRQQRMDA